MARPRKDARGPSARERIEAAFWRLLEQRGYRDITVAALSREAHVSPNTLYYHYDNIEAVARSSFDKALMKEFPSLLLARSREALDEKIHRQGNDIAQRIRRIGLFATDESGELRRIVVDTFIEVWSENLGTTPDELTGEERIKLAFMANGVVSIFDLAHENDFTALHVSMIDSHLIRGIIAEMNAIKARHPHPAPDECTS